MFSLLPRRTGFVRASLYSYGTLYPTLPDLVAQRRDQQYLTFEYASDLDHNGILYWLGTRCGQSPTWQNPALQGLVTVYCSQLAENPPSEPASAVVGRYNARSIVHCLDKLEKLDEPFAALRC